MSRTADADALAASRDEHASRWTGLAGKAPGGIFYAAVFNAVLMSWTAVSRPQGFFEREFVGQLSLVLWVPLSLIWGLRVAVAAGTRTSRGKRRRGWSATGWWLFPTLGLTFIVLARGEAIPRLTGHEVYGNPSANLDQLERFVRVGAEAVGLDPATAQGETSACESGGSLDYIVIESPEPIAEAEVAGTLAGVRARWDELNPDYLDRLPTLIRPQRSVWITMELDGSYVVAGRSPGGPFEVSGTTPCTRR